MTAEERAAWLAERRTGLGSSDAAAVCGLSPFKTPLHVYLDKVGPADEPEPGPDDPRYWGLKHEPAIAEAYSERFHRLLRPGRHCRSPIHPWLLATPDRISEDDRIVELKTARFASEGWGPEGTDQVPTSYLLQVQHQLAVTGLAVADLAVLVGGSEFRVYEIPRSEGVIERLVAVEAAFWAAVVARTPPPPDWSHPDTPALLDRLSRPDPGRSVNLTYREVELARQYVALGEQARAAEQVRAELKARLIDRMGAAGLALLPDGSRVTRSPCHRKGYAVPASDYTRFHVSLPKE